MLRPKKKKSPFFFTWQIWIRYERSRRSQHKRKTHNTLCKSCFDSKPTLFKTSSLSRLALKFEKRKIQDLQAMSYFRNKEIKEKKIQGIRWRGKKEKKKKQIFAEESNIHFLFPALSAVCHWPLISHCNHTQTQPRCFGSLNKGTKKKKARQLSSRSPVAFSFLPYVSKIEKLISVFSIFPPLTRRSGKVSHDPVVRWSTYANRLIHYEQENGHKEKTEASTQKKKKKRETYKHRGKKKSCELPKVIERKKEKRVKTCKTEERTALKVQVAFQRRACLQHFFYYIVSPIALLLSLIFFLVECSVLRSMKQA